VHAIYYILPQCLRATVRGTVPVFIPTKQQGT
jgi:hypothetical protein